jgi:small subunit ribosomal protein S21
MLCLSAWLSEKGANLAEVRVHEGESIEAALRRFKREVLKAGIILEIKKRKHHESKRQRKKRKKIEAKRKAVLNASRK